MIKVTRRRAGELVRKAFEILIGYPGGLPVEAVLKRIEQSASLTEFERTTNLYRFARPFEEITLFGAIAPVKAGWLLSDKDRWFVTEEGRRAYARFEDPERFLLEAGRLSIKGRLVTHAPLFYSYLCRTKNQCLTEYKLVRRIGFRRLLTSILGVATAWQKALPIQAPRRFVIPKLNLGNIDDLLRYLDSMGIPYMQGGHTIYIPPASIRLSAFQVVLTDYPPNVGLKIVKTQGGIDDSTYVFGSFKDRQIAATYKQVTYGHRHLTLVANLLFNHKIGPRLYDLIELQCGDQLWTAYVVEHVNGRVPSQLECESGVKKIRELERRKLIKVTLADGFEDEDFQCPTCNNNALVDDTGTFRYIDFQSFHLLNYDSFLKKLATRAIDRSHFGDRILLRGGHYLYQSIPGVRLPGRRNPEERAVALQQLMRLAGVSVSNRLVLDIGCNIGMMMAQYLKLGAKWCHGWDRSEITPHTEQLLLALGCTRFSTSGNDLSKGQELEADLPGFLKSSLNGCTISYLAVRGTLGWLDALTRIPWAFLIYEGHEDDTQEDFENYLEQLRRLVGFKVAAVRTYRDGDCDQRTIAILIRSVS